MRGSIVIGVALALAACGEAGVQYQGVVIEDKEAARWFDTAPAVGTPVPGAAVQLCTDGNCLDEIAYTDETGFYETDLMMFAGTFCTRTQVEVRVTAADGRQAGYLTIFEETSDPTQPQPYCDDVETLADCPEYFLNFQLGP